MLKKILPTCAIVFGLFFTITTVAFAYDESENSLSGKEIKSMSVQEVADYYEISAVDYASKLGDLLKTTVKTNDEIQRLHDNLGLEPSAAKEIAESLVSTSTVTPEQIAREKTQENEEGQNNSKQKYYFTEITIVTLLLYLLTWLLAKFGKIKLVTHRKIWNWILLISFIPAGIMGLMIALRLVYGIGLNLPFSLNYWHTIGGILMSEVAILHIIWHTRYYVLSFSRKNT